MKKRIIFGVILLAIILIGFLGYQIFSTLQHKKNVSMQLQTIPKFNFRTLNNLSFINENLAQNESTVFLFFNTQCEFCQSEAEQIKTHINDFKNTQVLFVSNEYQDSLQNFARDYKLSDYPFVKFLQLSANNLASFEVKTIPTVYVYGADSQLIKHHKGAFKVEKLLE